jgi:hypothetical protein
MRPCATCSTPGAPKKCPCGVPSYCGPECQKLHWDEHKERCTVFLSNETEKIKSLFGKVSIQSIAVQYNLCIALRDSEQFAKAEKKLLRCIEGCDALQMRSGTMVEKKLVIDILNQLATRFGSKRLFKKGPRAIPGSCQGDLRGRR